MKQSLLRRLLTTILLILLGTFITGQIAGYFIIKSWFLNEALNEITPQMQDVAEEIKIKNGSITITGKQHFIIKAYDLYNNEIPIILSDLKESEKAFSDEEIKRDFLPYLDKALAGNMVATIANVKDIRGKSIIIGLPIRDNGKILGTIFTLKPASDLDVLINGFYLVFLIASLVSTIIILVLIYYFTRKLINPLTEMAEVSNSMAAGNFTARAKEDGYGEIRNLSISLNNLAKRLFENDKIAKLLEQTRRDYIANVSHELRTPISSIRAISETLSDNIELGKDKKQRYYLIILRESKRLQKLINDMLELSRLQSGEMSITKSLINGKKLIIEIAEYFEIFSEDMNINFILTDKVLNIPDFYSNESRILQVLFILIENAFKFTPDDGEVKLDAAWDNEVIRISVENTGDGISNEDIQFIFERFYKGDKSHNQNGSGLGLSIAKEIIRNLGEEIYVSSKQGEKTRFEFTLHRNIDVSIV
jgi:signal transduction histidine kinase